jgi:hypothetical protein
MAFLAAEDDGTADGELERLLVDIARPLVRSIVRGQLQWGFWSAVVDQDDVEQAALTTVAACLGRHRSHDPPPAIRSFRDYVAVVTYNTCHQVLRARSPARERLRARVRYLLTHHPRLRLIEAPNHRRLAALAGWPPDRPPLPAEAVADATLGIERPAHLPGRPPGAILANLVVSLLERLGAPSTFESLVASMAAHLGVDGPPGAERPASEPPGASLSPVDTLEYRDRLERLWREIRELPVRQRLALLLNLRDEEGEGMVDLLPATGVATMAEIAAVLQMPEPELTAMWPALPHDDGWIAARLGVTRQQVSNLRKCARERLARRLRTSPVVRASGAALSAAGDRTP